MAIHGQTRMKQRETRVKTNITSPSENMCLLFPFSLPVVSDSGCHSRLPASRSLQSLSPTWSRPRPRHPRLRRHGVREAGVPVPVPNGIAQLLTAPLIFVHMLLTMHDVCFFFSYAYYPFRPVESVTNGLEHQSINTLLCKYSHLYRPIAMP